MCHKPENSNPSGKESILYSEYVCLASTECLVLEVNALPPRVV